jgi:hypothetical protein
MADSGRVYGSSLIRTRRFTGGGNVYQRELKYLLGKGFGRQQVDDLWQVIKVRPQWYEDGSMSPIDSVKKAFPDDVESAFGFLRDELFMSGPDRQSAVMPTAAYVRSGLRYSIRLDSGDQAVGTRVEMEIPGARLVTGPGAEDLMRAAGARTWHAHQGR